MTEHEYERRADDAERELADMEERSGKVGDHIDEAREDWAAKVADPSVPGAVGDPEPAGTEGDGPDQDEATGSDDEQPAADGRPDEDGDEGDEPDADDSADAKDEESGEA